MTASRIRQTRKVPAIRTLQPPARPWQVRHMAGVTLVELVITLSIAAILMTIAIPSFQDLMRSNRTATQVNEFLTALHLARSEAVKRGASVSVCSSTNSTTCRTSDQTNWAGGWILYVNGTTPLEVLRVWPAVRGAQAFTAGAGQVTFRGTGLATAAVTFSYKPKGCTGDQMRSIAINVGGHAISAKVTCS